MVVRFSIRIIIKIKKTPNKKIKKDFNFNTYSDIFLLSCLFCILIYSTDIQLNKNTNLIFIIHIKIIHLFYINYHLCFLFMLLADLSLSKHF